MADLVYPEHGPVEQVVPHPLLLLWTHILLPLLEGDTALSLIQSLKVVFWDTSDVDKDCVVEHLCNWFFKFPVFFSRRSQNSSTSPGVFFTSTIPSFRRQLKMTLDVDTSLLVFFSSSITLLTFLVGMTGLLLRPFLVLWREMEESREGRRSKASSRMGPAVLGHKASQCI